MRPPKWPPGVEPIGMEDLNRSERQFYWDGHLIEIRRFLVPTRFQKWFAAMAAIVGLLAGLSTIATGIQGFDRSGRTRRWAACSFRPISVTTKMVRLPQYGLGLVP
jgi:hypothetical protein